MKCSHYTTSYAFGCFVVVFVLSFCTTPCGFAPTSCSILFTSSSTNLRYGSTFSGCNCDYSASITIMVFICCLFFTLIHLWLFIFLTSSLVYQWFLSLHLLLLSCPLGLASFSSFWHDVSMLVGLPHTKSRKVFWYMLSLYLYFLSSALCWAMFFSNSLEKYSSATSPHSLYIASKSFILFLVLMRV